MGMIQLPADFKEFLKLLNSNSVEYLLVGGYAVNYYGYARATADMDIWIGTDHNNTKKIASVLRSFGFDQASADLFAEPGRVIRMGVPPIRIEILTSISGADFHTSYGNRRVVEIGGVPASMIALDDLKANKKASGRLKDLVDLEQLS